MEKLISDKIKQDIKEDGHYIAFKSTVAGYHIFKVRPIAGPQFPMVLLRERTNVIHKNAILINSLDSSKYTANVVEQF